jgi:hypothetical protein
MFFTRTDWLLMKFALRLALLTEAIALWVLYNTPFGPGATEQTGIKYWVEEVVFFIHLPVFDLPVLNNASELDVWCLVFLFGYIEQLIAIGLILFVFRLGARVFHRM